MTCDPAVVKQQLSALVERLQESHTSREDTTIYLGRLFMRIYKEFPGDVGCFVIYFLNHVILEPGEAIFLGPNYPHAYLSGGKSVQIAMFQRRSSSCLLGIKFISGKPEAPISFSLRLSVGF